MRKDKNTGGSREPRHHRAYRDPTADTAIGNIMREERMKKKEERKKATASRKRYGTGGVWHAEK